MEELLRTARLGPFGMGQIKRHCPKVVSRLGVGPMIEQLPPIGLKTMTDTSSSDFQKGAAVLRPRRSAPTKPLTLLTVRRTRCACRLEPRPVGSNVRRTSAAS